MNTEQIYLSLLRQALWQTKEQDMQGEINYQELMRLAHIQGTDSLVYDVLLKNAIIPDDVKQTMKQVCLNQMMNYTQLKDGLVFTFNILKDNAIKPVLLKGFGLAMLYPKPYLRNWGDLDLYVGPKQYHKAAAVLRNTFPKARHHDEEWEELKHYNFVLPDGSLIEMHRRTMAFFSECDKRLFYRLEDEAMNGRIVDVEGYTIYVPDDCFNMLFVFAHAWEHFYESGAGMKQIADVALLAHHLYQDPQCDKAALKQYLLANLKKLHLLQPWRIMGYIIVKALGLPKSEWPGYSDSRCTLKYGERLYRRVMTEGMARTKDFGDSKDRYEARDKAMALPVWRRKLLTVESKVKDCTPMWRFAPLYTMHRLTASLWHGVKRTLKGEKMVLY